MFSQESTIVFSSEITVMQTKWVALSILCIPYKTKKVNKLSRLFPVTENYRIIPSPTLKKHLYAATQANNSKLLLRETRMKKTKIPNARTAVISFANLD